MLVRIVELFLICLVDPSEPACVPLPWTGAKDPLPWSDRPFSSSVVKSDILSGLRICMFSRPESTVFTVKNGICRWAGENRGKNVDFWRAVTFKQLRMAAFQFPAFDCLDLVFPNWF